MNGLPGGRIWVDYKPNGQKTALGSATHIGVHETQLLRIRNRNHDALKSKQDTLNLIGQLGTRNFPVADDRCSVDRRLGAEISQCATLHRQNPPKMHNCSKEKG